MADITCTITKDGRCDKYGRPLKVGMSYTGSFEEVRGLYLTGFASVADKSVFDDDAAPGGSYFAPIPSGALPVATTTNPLTGRIGKIQGMPAAGALRVCLVGHSYLDQETGTYSYNRPIEMINGTFVWANVFLGRPFEIIKAHAIGGERLIDLADRIDAAVSEDADVYVWNIGINDLKSTVNSGSSRYTGKPYVADPNQTNLAYCADLADRLLAKLANTGAIVLVLPETWPANGAGDQTKHLAARTMQYNEYLRWRAMQDRNMHYIPLDLYTIDPTSATGDVLTGHYGDFIHPSNLGAFNRGKALAAAIKPLLPKLINRLPTNVVETYSNLKLVGTSLSAQDNGTLRVMLPNVTSSNTLIRTGDDVSLAVPAAGKTQWNGRWRVVAHSSTYIDVNCPVAGSYAGTINVSSARQMFDNPLYLTQSGGSLSGGGTLTAGTVPSGVSVACPAGSSCAFDNAQAHYDLSGAADGLGNWMDVTVTGGANAIVNIFFLANRGPAIPASAVYGRLFSGDIVQALFDTDVVSINGVTSMVFGMTGAFTHATDGAQNLLVYSLYTDGVNPSSHPNLPFRGVVGTAEYQIPPGVLEAFDGTVEIKFGASGGGVRLRIGRTSIKALNRSLRDVSKSFDI